ncbi:hypothetical protein DSL72_003818 [Monilinia vaccinii-corymbosi]|uniref:Uncharacterized protein n=1 Tax=Monilinia vaccinii-corymbosi TaxID=61207 RepID=A0A8A3NUD2_9HELO|nr:hypothetical protein DSL72_003818 [Monilinia vaccinii-corymbosi]
MHPSKFLEFAAYVGLSHGACDTNVTISGLGGAADGQPAIDRQFALFSFGGSSCNSKTTTQSSLSSLNPHSHPLY